MPGLPREGEVLIREFTGVNITVDPGLLSPEWLQHADNWVPDRTYLLTKRKGSTVVASRSAILPSRVDALFRAYDLVGNRYFYFVAVDTPSGDEFNVLKNTGVIEAVTPLFDTPSQRYGITQLGNNVYAGNGVDPIRVIDLAFDYKVAIKIMPLDLLDATGVHTGFAPDATSKLENGVYAYAWAAYSRVQHRYLARTDAFSVELIGDRTRVDFYAPNPTAPGTTLDEVYPDLGATYQLFVAPRSLPVEFAFRQFDDVSAGTFRSLSEVRDTGPLIPTRPQALRTGRFLVPHRGRLYIAGDTANPSRLYATGIIVPGLEQDLFNMGDFFPANANLPVNLNDGDEITGMVVGAQRETNNDPRAPLLVFKNASTWALYGDMFDPDAIFANLSQSIGCISHRTAVATPVGAIWCGLDSVYIFSPAAPEPIDIGKPISAYIRSLDPIYRQDAHAIYHDGFYKLYTVPPGGTQPTRQWWLDLRQGIDPNQPSWWGPHHGGAIESACVARRDEDNASRAYGAYRPPTSGPFSVSYAIDELNIDIYTTECTVPINTSTLRTTIIDNQTPFARKIFTRFRALGRTEVDTTVHLDVFQDGDTAPSVSGSLDFTGAEGSFWDVGVWDEATWGTPARFTEGDLVLGGSQPRPHTLYTEFVLTHDAITRLDLRDFAARLLPVERPVK